MTFLFDTEYQGYTQGHGELDVAAMRFNVYVQSWQGCHGPDQRIEKAFTGLKFEQIKNRWWFFRRWAARLQMENPMRVYGFLLERTMNEKDGRKAAITRLINRQRSAKAKVTEISGRIEKGRAQWNKLFPIEDDPDYQSAFLKLCLKQQAVEDLQKEIDQLTKEQTP